MGRAFSEDAKNHIREQLRAKAGELFQKYGLKKTTIDDITRETGIGRGSFYLFYDSKETLYLDLIETAEDRVKETILAGIQDNRKSVEKQFAEFLNQAFLILDQNILMKNLLNSKEEFEMLLRTVPGERLAHFLDHDNRTVKEILDIFRKKGKRLAIDPQVFSGMLRSVYLLSLHKDLVGTEVFPKVISFLAEAVAARLVRGEP